MKRYRVRGYAESELDIQASAPDPDDPWRVALAGYEAGTLTVTPETAMEVAKGLTELANHCDGYVEDRREDPATRAQYRGARDGLSTLAGKVWRDFPEVPRGLAALEAETIAAWNALPDKDANR